MWQLRLSNLCETDQRIGATIIYNLNEDGYLETPVEELAAQLEIDPEQVEPRAQADPAFRSAGRRCA